MLKVDSSLFGNVIVALQRTSRLTGGAVRGLPGGQVVDGLQGVTSFGSDISEAQKEFELGRVRGALDRVRQIETQFNGIAGRWSSMVGTILSTARQGNQQLPMQKLNEVRAAQSKMQQLVGPATKSFRDLISALELAVSNEGHTEKDSEPPVEEASADTSTGSDGDPSNEKVDDTNPPDSTEEPETTLHPSLDLLGRFADKYQYGDRLGLTRGPDQKLRVEPAIEADRFYFLESTEPPRIIRVRQRKRSAVLVLDTHESQERWIEAEELKILLRGGIWILDAT